MANSNCLATLNNYGDFLNNNPTGDQIDYFAPHPLIFDTSLCNGSYFPQFKEEPNEMYEMSTRIGSLYIPPFWEVVIRGKVLIKSGKFNIPMIQDRQKKICASQFPLLIPDTTLLFFDPLDKEPYCTVVVSDIPNDKVSIYSSFKTSVTFVSKVPQQPGLLYNQNCWAFDMCNRYITTHISSRTIHSYQPGSEECDVLMDDFCSKSTNYQCRLNVPSITTNMNLKECSCLSDEKKLREDFCTPGNNMPECAQQNAFQEFIPVTCFGKNCGSSGYKFNRMNNQKCNVTLCQQVIDIIGDSLTINTSSIIYCGSKNYEAKPTPTPTPTPVSEDKNIYLEGWEWGLIILGVFLVFVIIPLSVMVFYRSIKEDLEDKKLKQEELKTGIDTLGIDNFIKLVS